MKKLFLPVRRLVRDDSFAVVKPNGSTTRDDPFARPDKHNPKRAVAIEKRAVEAAIWQLRDRLAELDGIMNLTGTSDIQPHQQAKGFLVKVPGIGRLFAITAEALRDWITGSLTLRTLLKELDREGWLVRGCDGKSTRQVVIPGIGRHRYYCLKLQTAANRTLIDGRPQTTRRVLEAHATSQRHRPLTITRDDND